MEKKVLGQIVTRDLPNIFNQKTMQLSEELVYHVHSAPETRIQHFGSWPILLGPTHTHKKKKNSLLWHSGKIKNHNYVNPVESAYSAFELCYVIFLVMLGILLWAT